MSKIAVRVEHLQKVYKLYNKPMDRLKESLRLTRKKLYREHYALNDVNFQVEQGETVGIIGTNGSGKSTILKIITGVLNQTAGKVEVNGRISALLELGAGFNPEYSGLENVYLNGTMLGFSRKEIDQKLDSILKFADIGEFVHQPVKTYSSGMFVRLAFAVAINIDPEILIVDEALSVGDVFFQAKCYHKFEEFKAMGKTILMVSHDLGSVGKYCDRVVLLNQGVKVDEGDPKKMIDLYKKILAGQEQSVKEEEAGEAKSVVHESGSRWQDHLQVNPQLLEYGEKKAEIIDFAILDETGQITNSIDKGSECRIRMKVHFYEQVQEPIFAYTIKNLRGTEITGTNTMYEHVSIPPQEPGDEQVLTFRQKIDLQGGEYLLSLGCTGYRDGDFHVYHRLYDICDLIVISTKNTVGFYDMNTKVEFE